MLDIDIGTKKATMPELKKGAIITETDIAGLNQSSSAVMIRLFSLIILAIFVLLVVFLYGFTASKSAKLKNRAAAYNNLDQQIKSSELATTDLLAQNLGKGLQKISQLLSSRPSWSILFKELQSVTPNDVIYSSFNVNDKTMLAKLSGTASDFSSVALLLAALQNSDKFSDVKLISASKSSTGENRTAFDLELKVVTKNLLLFANQNGSK